MSNGMKKLDKYKLAYLEDENLLCNVIEEIEKENKCLIIEIELYLSIDNSISILIQVGSVNEIYKNLHYQLLLVMLI